MGVKIVWEGIKRMWIPVLVAAAILGPDAGSHVVLFALGITLLVSAISHIMRKVLFPYVVMSEFANKAMESPIGAAVVFSSITFILSVIIFSTCMLLK